MGRSIIFWRYFSPIIIAVIVLTIIVMSYLPKYMEDVAIEQAIVESKQLAFQLEELRAYYTTHVIEKVVSGSDITPSAHHKNNPQQIPLPATLIHDLNERYASRGVNVRLYSKYPFPNRQSRILGEAELMAIERVTKSKDAIFTQVFDKEGERFLRVAIADVMSKAACVDCHNNYPQTPKTDWKVGDVRGVLEVIKNLDPVINYGKQISINIALMFIALLAIAAVVMFIVAKNIYASLRAQNQANIDLSISVDQLANANEQIKKTTEQLIKSERVALLDNLVVGVSHELNTPLGVSVTVTSTINEEVKQLEQQYLDKTLTSKKLASFLQKAKSSVDLLETNMERVSKLLFNFKNIVIDQSKEFKEIDFHRLLDDVVVTLSTSFIHKNIAIEVKSEGSWTIETSPSCWIQVISILTENTLEHAFENRESGNITISAKLSGKSMTFTFTDDGAGMTDDIQAHIFQPFYTTKRGQGGTGLGLHVLSNIVELKLNGEISCQSTVDQGTKFTITVALV